MLHMFYYMISSYVTSTSWLETITVGQAIAWIGGITAAIVAGVPAIKFIAGIVRELQRFFQAWNGVPERWDITGKILIDPGKPGIPALLERVRMQVENDHSTNFREDLDRANKSIENISKKLDEHIVISKHHDREQAKTHRAQIKTQQALDQHIESTQVWTGMLTDLHRDWSKDPDPDDTSE